MTNFIKRKKVARVLRSRAGGQAQKSLGGKPVVGKKVVRIDPIERTPVIGQPVPVRRKKRRMRTSDGYMKA